MISAVAAAATAILTKVGVEGVPAALATAIRTIVVAIFACTLVFAQRVEGVAAIRARSWVFLVLSGLATGVSWVAYFRALQLGPASRVAPIDKLSLPLTIILATLLLGESVRWKVVIGIMLMTVGALLTLG